MTILRSPVNETTKRFPRSIPEAFRGDDYICAIERPGKPAPIPWRWIGLIMTILYVAWGTSELCGRVS